HEDRARAGPQPYGDDRGQPAPPAAASGELLRIGSMRMAAVVVMRVGRVIVRGVILGGVIVRLMRMMRMVVMRVVAMRVVAMRGHRRVVVMVVRVPGMIVPGMRMFMAVPVDMGMRRLLRGMRMVVRHRNNGGRVARFPSGAPIAEC